MWIGCKVIGFAGTEDKLKWLKDDLGFDHVFNYKTVNVHKTLREVAPKGVDCYFDNVRTFCFKINMAVSFNC